LKLKHTLYLFIFFFPIFLIGQGVSILPSQLDASTFGSWEDEENELRLIIRDEYIVIQNELFYYYEIVKENETLN